MMPRGHWFKSSKSANDGQCVETHATTISEVVFMRDSKSPSHCMSFTFSEWKSFIQDVKNGHLDG